MNVNLSQFFKVAHPNCTYIGWNYTYAVVQGNHTYADAQALPANPRSNFNVTGETLSIYKNYPNLIEMFVMVSSGDTRYGFKHFRIQICGYENLTDLSNETISYYWDNPVP